MKRGPCYLTPVLAVAEPVIPAPVVAEPTTAAFGPIISASEPVIPVPAVAEPVIPAPVVAEPTTDASDLINPAPVVAEPTTDASSPINPAPVVAEPMTDALGPVTSNPDPAVIELARTESPYHMLDKRITDSEAADSFNRFHGPTDEDKRHLLKALFHIRAMVLQDEAEALACDWIIKEQHRWRTKERKKIVKEVCEEMMQKKKAACEEYYKAFGK